MYNCHMHIAPIIYNTDTAYNHRVRNALKKKHEKNRDDDDATQLATAMTPTTVN